MPPSESIHDVKVTDISRSGPGVARDASGRVIFVPFTAPGDLIRVRVIEDKKTAKARYAEGQLVEVLEPSPIRLKPRCPVFSQCGGCQWQHLPYDLQWKTKRGGLEQALGRVKVGPTFGIDFRIEDLPAELQWEYRNRIQLRGENDHLGFYRSKSHEVVAIDRCDIARAEINRAWPEILEESGKHKQPFKVEVEIGEDGAIHQSWNKEHAALGFRQVHDAQNEKLRTWVKGVITPGRPILDLFGGSGNLSLQFVSTAPEIHCVDLSVPRNRPLGLPELFSFHRASVFDWMKKFSGSPKPWSVILDPPREGLGPETVTILERLEKNGAQEIVLVGCDVDSWAKDVSRILNRKWKLGRVAALDLFPQTSHVESLALFIK